MYKTKQLILMFLIFRRRSSSTKTPTEDEIESEGAVEEEVEDEEARSDDESWNSEDDPDRLWCICQKPHNNKQAYFNCYQFSLKNYPLPISMIYLLYTFVKFVFRFMICCDECEEWFHGRCVGITKAMGKSFVAFYFIF